MQKEAILMYVATIVLVKIDSLDKFIARELDDIS